MELSKETNDAIAKAIQVHVNGKIDKMQTALDEHVLVCLPAIEQRNEDMSRMLPVIEAYESAQQDLKTAQKGGKLVLWVAATTTALGGAWLVIRQIFWG